MHHPIAVPPKMRVGKNAVAALPQMLKDLDASRPLIVTDTFLNSSGMVERVIGLLEEQGAQAEVFDGVVPDPTTETIDAALRQAIAHSADAVIGLGGGSPIDTAKAISVLALREGPLRELKAPVSYDGPALPIIAIPTTAGTGSEATQFTVVTDAQTGEKMLCAGPSYLPRVALIDYELTMGMPARLTADTGIDALTHAVEAYVSRHANPFTDSLALGAMRLIGSSLRTAYSDGGDEKARADMMYGATLAGMAFSNSSVALVHGMSRPIGAHFGVAHGMANAMLFAAVAEFSATHAEGRYADCARAYGVATDADDDARATTRLIEELRSLTRDLEVPSPQSYGISKADWEAAIPTMADQAIASGSPANNPRVPQAHEIARLYEDIFSHGA